MFAKTFLIWKMRLALIMDESICVSIHNVITCSAHTCIMLNKAFVIASTLELEIKLSC